MKEEYIKLTIQTDRPVNELIIGFLSGASAAGFVEEFEKVECYFNKERWTDEIEMLIIKFLDQLKSEGLVNSFTWNIEDVKNIDWNGQWESSIEPVEVTPNVAIKPSWKNYNGNAGIVVEIDPKMSFGTGHHETTRMMIQMIEKYIKKGSTVLDVGTGTGVLAIVAARLGAKKVVGLDTDEWSIENARENVLKNGVADVVNIVRGEISFISSSVFDMVLANLNRNTLLNIAAGINEALAKNGLLIISGVLTLDEGSVVSCYEETGLRFIESHHEGDWSVVVLQK
ncbi:MAG: 50S ribosomal protein L11 methyltransferase [Candidatus Kryptoniota bacterium]